MERRSGRPSHDGAAMFVFFFFQAEDGIRDYKVTGVQTCALPICMEAAGQPLRPDPAHPFRQRGSRQGDIVNSQIWHTGRPVDNSPLPGYAAYALAQQKRQPMIYVGGNDGMLHGFSATDGSEKIAYIPRGVISGLARLSDLDYDTRHRYFVDGSAMSGDINSGSHASPQWRTVLAGMPGAGAKGYFVLDITHPERSEEHTSELQSPCNLVCRLLLEKKNPHPTHSPAPTPTSPPPPPPPPPLPFARRPTSPPTTPPPRPHTPLPPQHHHPPLMPTHIS